MGQFGQAPGIALPILPPWARNLLIALFGLYAMELFLANVVGAPIGLLMWWPIGTGDARLWQPITRYLVQGNDVLSVVLGGVVLYFFLPTMERLLSPRKALELGLSAFAGGTLLGFVLDLMGLLRQAPATGWGPLLTAMIVLFGLSMPTATIRLFFVLPVPASIFVWGTGLVTGLMLLATLTLGTADHFGTFLGVLAWWNLRGPAARRRSLLRKSRKIERDLERFQVIDGGRSGNRDDTVH